MHHVPLLVHDAGEGSASIVDTASGQELFTAHTMDRVWVELAANSSAAHGPTLRIRLASRQHPAVQSAPIKAAYPDQAQRQQKASQLGTELPRPRQAALQHGNFDTFKQLDELHGRPRVTERASLAGKQHLTGLSEMHNKASGAANGQVDISKLEKPKPGRKAKKVEPEVTSIAAVLTAESTSQHSGEHHGDSMIGDHGITDEAACCPEQLLQCSAPLCIEPGVDRWTLLQTLWQMQLQLGKMSARADTALSHASSQRMTTLQTKMSDLTLEMRDLRQQLQVV